MPAGYSLKASMANARILLATHSTSVRLTHCTSFFCCKQNSGWEDRLANPHCTDLYKDIRLTHCHLGELHLDDNNYKKKSSS